MAVRKPIMKNPKHGKLVSSPIKSKRLILLASLVPLLMLVTPQAFADPHHCSSYSECYNIGYGHGYSDAQNRYSPTDACQNHSQAFVFTTTVTRHRQSSTELFSVHTLKLENKFCSLERNRVFEMLSIGVVSIL